MFEKIEECPICGGKEIINQMICKDHSISQEEFLLTRCADCNFLFTNPRPEPNSIEKYYDSEQYISHKDKGNSPINIMYKMVRVYTLYQKFKLIKSYHKASPLLDIGAGTGHFASYMKKRGYNVSAFEPNPLAFKQLSGKISNSHQDLNHFSDQQFKTITLWHVLEHIHDLNASIKQIKSMLDRSGILFVAVPNYKSYDAKEYGKFWAAYDVPRHLYHFEQKTMRQLMKKHGLSVVAIKPMKFDAYYVSMLSEQYMNGKSNMVSAIKTGMKSNKYAQSHDQNYSSLIYIIKRK